MFQYFIKVVSTQFRSLNGDIVRPYPTLTYPPSPDVLQVNTHQYSVTHFERDLSTGSQGNTQQGLHLSHGTTGVPGASTFYN